MLIVIPTYRRVANQRTYQQLRFTDFADNILAVCDEVDEGELRAQGMRTFLVPTGPDGVKSIADKRAYILRQFKDSDKLVMFDDDLRFFNRIGDTVKLEPASPESLNEMLSTLSALLDKYVHVGVSARGGNNNLKSPFEMNTRMMYVLGYRPQVVATECELGRIQHREDFDYTLQLLRKGYENVVLSHWACDNVYNEAGGASLERTTEASNEDAYKLAQLHPGLVVPRERAYKASIPRVEVTCYWKKALAQGQKA